MNRACWTLAAALLLGGCGTQTALPLGQTLQASGQRFAARAAGDYTLFTQPGTAGVQAIFGGIDQASQSIDITMYTLQSQDIVTHLAAASARGVTVRLLLERDPFYLDHTLAHRPVPLALRQPPKQPPAPSSLRQGLDPTTAAYSSNQAAAADLQAKTAQAKVPAQIFWTDDARFALTHEKAMVIDHQAAFIMSNNFTSNGLGGNREYGVIDRAPAEVREVEAIFQADITGATYLPTQPALVVSPDDGSGMGNAKHKLMALIASAQHSVQIEDEEFQDADVATLLGQVAARGVSVQILLDPSAKAKSDPYLLPQKLAPAYWAPPNATLHAKLVIADGQAAYLGSINFSTQSMGYNRELGIELRDPAILAELTSDFAADWAAGAARMARPQRQVAPKPAKPARR